MGMFTKISINLLAIVLSMTSWAINMWRESRLASQESGCHVDVKASLRQALRLEAEDRWPEARELLMNTLRGQSTDHDVLLTFGRLLLRHRQSGAGLRVLTRALEYFPHDSQIHCLLGHGYMNCQEWSIARDHYRQALMDKPFMAVAELGLALALENLGEDGEMHRRRAFSRSPALHMDNPGEKSDRPTILVLASASGGNTPIDAVFCGWDWPQVVVEPRYFPLHKAALPRHQLVFNAISDADKSQEGLEAAISLLKKTTCPVINAPGPLLATTRVAMAQRLRNIPGVRTPRIERVPKECFLAPNASRAFQDQDWEFPLLLRSPGYHTGQQFVRVLTAEELGKAAQALPGHELYIMEHLPTRHQGQYRKYRWILVDGQWFPLHRVVSSSWNVHGFSSDLAVNASYRQQEDRFFCNPELEMGKKAWQALQELAPLLPFDLGGIDCDVSEEGELLVFEANATMTMLAPHSDPIWDYRRPYYVALLGAIRAMMRRAIGWE